jgi:hypothetical protein
LSVLTHSLAIRLGQPPDDIAVALARFAQRAQPVDHRTIPPDQSLSLLVGPVLEADVAERERFGNRIERLDANPDPDHDSLVNASMISEFIAFRIVR